jgi:hypothetical protein
MFGGIEENTGRIEGHVLPKARKGQAQVDKAFQRAIKTYMDLYYPNQIFSYGLWLKIWFVFRSCLSKAISSSLTCRARL